MSTVQGRFSANIPRSEIGKIHKRLAEFYHHHHWSSKKIIEEVAKYPPPLYCKEGDYKDKKKKKILEPDSKHFERRRMEKSLTLF